MSADPLRHALRSVRRQPFLFTLTTAVLALTIAASTTVFSVVDAVLLRPLPFADAGRLVVVWEQVPEIGSPFMEVAYGSYKEWKAQARRFSSLAIMETINSKVILSGDEPIPLAGRLVSWNFFATLGADAQRGRTLSPEDDRPGAPRVVVISQRLWTRMFDADPGVVGRTLVLNGTATTVVGVMPPAFRYPPGADLWIPIVAAAPEAVAHPGLAWTVVVGRLAGGASLDDARAELDVVIARTWHAIRTAHPEVTEPDHRAVVTPLTRHLFGSARPALFLLLGSVLLVLLLACVNISALLLAKSEAKEGEMAIRLALGASRGHLVRQLLAESAVIALVGGLAGVVFSVWAVPVVMALVPTEVPRLEDATVDGRVLLFSIVMTGLATVMASLAPALVASRATLTGALSQTARVAGPPHRRLRGMFVGGQVTVAMVLLSAAMLLVQSFKNLAGVDLGFQPGQVLAAGLSGASQRYPRPQDLYRVVLDRIGALPGVQAVGAAGVRPLRDKVGNQWPFELEGQSREQAQSNPFVNLEDVTPGYFETLRVRVLRGRTFTERDDEQAPGVAVVSASMAERCWPGQDAIGKRLRIPLPGTRLDGSLDAPGRQQAWLTVIGVVGEGRYRDMRAARMDLYMSYRQTNHGLSHLFVRTVGDPMSAAPAVRAVVREVDGTLLLSDIETMDTVVAAAVGGERFAMWVISGFALVALLLTTLGTYGVMAFAVGRRTREIGIRMALGARAGHVTAMVLGQGLLPVLIGLGVGVAGCLALGRLVGGLLYGVPAHDPATLSAVSVVLVVVAFAACAIPARRAARVDPARALSEG